MKEVEFTNIINAVTRELGEGAVSLSKDIGRYMESVLADIAAYHQWSWLENVPFTLTTDSGQTYITIPDYIGGEITIHQDAAGREIRYVDPHEYARLLGASTATTTKPDRYTVRANRFEFYPPLTTSNSVIVFATIDSDQISDTSPASIAGGIRTKIPNHFATVIEWGVLRKIDSDNNKKMEWMNLYYAELKIKKSTDGVTKGRSFVGQRDRAILNSRTYLRG